jgi:hypothetical protein
LFANQGLQCSLATLSNGELDAAHNVGSVPCLRVQGSSHRQDFARLEVQQLGGDRGGSKVDRDTEPWAWDELKTRFVGQNCGIPLRQFEFEIGLGMRAAGQAPALFQLGCAQPGSIFFMNLQRTR